LPASTEMAGRVLLARNAICMQKARIHAAHKAQSTLFSAAATRDTTATARSARHARAGRT
jgi:hypothetical protein